MESPSRAPALRSARASSPRRPVAVEVPGVDAARLDLRAPSCVGLWTSAGPALSPRRGRVEANQPAPIVMNGGVLLVELHVEAKKELIVAVAPVLVL